MTTALIYVLTSIALALVMLVLGKIADKPRTDANVYAYPKKTVWLVFGLSILLMVMALMMMLVSPRRSWGAHPIAPATIGTVLLFGYLLLWLHIRSYRIALVGKVLHISSLFFRRSVELDSVKRFAIIQGGSGGQFLELYDARNRRVFKAADTIQDFSDLTSLIHHQVAGRDVSFDSRDKWGKWTRSQVFTTARTPK